MTGMPPATPAASAPPQRVSAFGQVALCLGAALLWNVLCYWHTAASIAGIWWRSDTFAHGLVVLPVFAWLVWRRREAVGILRPQPMPWLALPAAGAAGMWLMGELGSAAAVTHTGFVLLVLVSMVAVLGARLARVLLFPLLFLLFGLPVGEFVLPALMSMTANFTVASLRLSGVPVYQEGLQFVIPNGHWSVVEACSGIRYLIASLMLGTLYAWLNYRRAAKRLAFMAAALVVPVVANWLRAYLIVMLGYLSNNQLASGVDHLIYGWVFFGIVIMCLFWVGQRWADDDVKSAASSSTLSSPSSSMPAGEEYRPTRWLKLLPLMAVSLGMALVQGGMEDEIAPFTVAYDLPAPAAGWHAENPDSITYRAHYTGSRGAADAVYGTAEGAPVLLQTAFFARQRGDAEMVSWGNGLLAGDAPNRAALIPGTLVDNALGSARSATLGGGAERLHIWQWYVIDGQIVVADWEAKGRLVLDRLVGGQGASMVFVLATRAGEDGDDGKAEAEARLARFVDDHAIALNAIFARAGREVSP